MSFRDTLNRYSLPVTICALLAVGAACYMVFRQAVGAGDRKFQTAAYFSTDDGKTWFEDDVKRKPPFEVGGAQAVQVHVFTCDGKPFAGYLQRFSPEMKAAMAQLDADVKAGRVPNFGKLASLRDVGTQVKRPGDKDWVGQGSTAGAKIIAVTCPNGSAAKAVNP